MPKTEGSSSTSSRRKFLSAGVSVTALTGLMTTSACQRQDSARSGQLHPSLNYDFWSVEEKVTVAEKIDTGPGLVKTRTGELLAFFGSPHATEHHAWTTEEKLSKLWEIIPPPRLLMSRSKDGGLTWSAPIELPVPAGFDVHYGQPSCAITLSSGRVLLIARLHKPRASRLEWFHTDHVPYYSDDDGLTWKIGDRIETPLAVRNQGYAGGELLEIDGTAWLGFQGALTQEEAKLGTYSAFFLRSRDSGKTWGEPTVLIRPGGHCVLAAEPTLTKLDDGTLVALVRYHGEGDKAAATVRVESRDDGKTWSKPVHQFVGAMDCLRSLPGGGLMVSHVSTAGIVVRFSYDDGWTWTREVWAFDVWQEGQYRNGAAWNQSVLVRDQDTILCGFAAVAPEGPEKDKHYEARDPRNGLAARIRFLRRQKDKDFFVPRYTGG